MGYAAAGTLIATGVTTGLSFYQSSQQKKMQKEAEVAARIAMEDAKKKLDVNFYKSLGIVKEPYELEREAVLSNMAGVIQAGVESNRGVASVAGMVNMANNTQQRNIAGTMGREMMDLNKLVATEDASLNMAKANLDLGTANGAQLAARNRETMANQSFMQGMEGVTSMVGQVAAMPSLYGNKELNNSDMPNYGDVSNPTPAQEQANKGMSDMAQYQKEYESAYYNNKFDPNYKKLIVDNNGKLIPFEQAYKNSGLPLQDYLEFLKNNQNNNLGY